ncbi:MAG: MMPL family transporter [Proteobacteria bacterium]|nr:MMPL family transporter [Pseudomonadota bacterium]
MATLVSLMGSSVSDLVAGSDAVAAKQDAQAVDAVHRSMPAEPKGQLCSQAGRVCVVQALLAGNSSDLDYATRILERSEELLERVRPQDAPSDLRLVVGGQYRSAPLGKRLAARDLRKTAVLSSALVLLVVFAQFRGLRVLLYLGAPLAAGAVWTLGLIASFTATLNLISAFGLTLLAGLGVDYGLHLLTHYGTYRARGGSAQEALGAAFDELGSSMLMATATTCCGFAALAAADFSGFAEMGIIAAVGTTLMFLATVLLLPPLLLLGHRIVPERRPLLRAWPRLPRLSSALRRTPRALVLGGLIAAGALGLSARDLDFEYDFTKLQPREMSHGVDWGRAMHGTSRTAIVVLGEDADSVEQVVATLRKMGPAGFAHDPDSWLVTSSAFIPPDQAARLAQIARLSKTLAKGTAAGTSQQQRLLARWRALAAVRDPIDVQSLPRWVTQWLTDNDGNFGSFGIIYTDWPGSNAREMERLARRVDSWRERFPQVRFAAPSALLGTVIPALRADAPWIVALALLGLLLGTLVIGRSFWRTLLVMLPLCVSMSMALGVLVLLDIKLSMYNLLVFPLAFGLGIDGAVYVAWGMLGADADRGDSFATGRAVFGSATTDVAAFSSLAIAANPGLVSLGVTAAVTLSSNVLVNLVWLPALVRVAKMRRYLRTAQPTSSAHKGP